MESKREKLIALLKNLSPEQRNKLEESKTGKKELERPDFIWHFLLQSFSTMGNSRGHAGLILNQENYRKVTFEVITELPKNRRSEHIKHILSIAKVRMPSKKAEWLDINHDLIAKWGGLEQVKQKALACVGTEAKINFMKKFAGIGDKYARNIWMDVYHPDFHNCIAVDKRIKKITATLGFSFEKYDDYERFYQKIAKETGLQGWELDRLLYNYTEEFLQGLN